MGDVGEDVVDPSGEVRVVFEDERAGESGGEHRAPDVCVRAPAADFGGRGGLGGFVFWVVGERFFGDGGAVDLSEGGVLVSGYSARGGGDKHTPGTIVKSNPI